MTFRGLSYLGFIAAVLFAAAFPALMETTTIVEKARMAVKLIALGSAAVYLYRQAKPGTSSSPLAGGALALLAVLLGMAGYWWKEAALASLLLLPMAIATILHGESTWRFRLIVALLALIGAFPMARLEEAIENLLGYSVIIAKTSGFLLYYFGYELRVTGDTIVTPKGALQVVGACSGLKMMLLLAALVFCYGLVFELSRKAWLSLAGWAFLAGIVVSILRVDVIIFCIDSPELFHFFHEGPGTELFTIVALLGTAILGRHIIEPPLIKMLQEKRPEATLSGRVLPALMVPAGLGLLGGLALWLA